MMNFTGTLITTDKPSEYSGFTYPKAVLQKLENDFTTKTEKYYYGGYNFSVENASPSINFEDVTHEVTSLELLPNGELNYSIQILDTPKGLLLQKKIKKDWKGSFLLPDQYRLSMVCQGSINEEQIVQDDTVLLRVDIVQKS